MQLALDSVPLGREQVAMARGSRGTTTTTNNNSRLYCRLRIDEQLLLFFFFYCAAVGLSSSQGLNHNQEHRGVFLKPVASRGEYLAWFI